MLRTELGNTPKAAVELLADMGRLVLAAVATAAAHRLLFGEAFGPEFEVVKNVLMSFANGSSNGSSTSGEGEGEVKEVKRGPELDAIDVDGTGGAAAMELEELEPATDDTAAPTVDEASAEAIGRSVAGKTSSSLSRI